MGTTQEEISAAIAARDTQPVGVVVSVKEELPPSIDGVPTRPSKDINPGCFYLDPAPNWSSYWRTAIARHHELIAGACISPVGAIRVRGLGNQEENSDDLV